MTQNTATPCTIHVWWVPKCGHTHVETNPVALYECDFEYPPFSGETDR